MKFKSGSVLLASLYWAASSVVTANAALQAPQVPIAKFAQVTPFLYRGARPGEVGVKALGALKFKTDLNIDDDAKSNRDEEVWAKQSGLNYISVPLSGFFAPTDESVDRIIKVIRDSSNYPIFLHCKHGEDRTGLIVGLYRYYDQHWSADAAYEEMLARGFHKILLGLDSYYKQKTGMKISVGELQ